MIRYFSKNTKINIYLVCVKTALDGCFGSVDVALYQLYEGTSNKGVLYYNDEEVTDFCKSANREGLQIELHAIGDAAFDQARPGSGCSAEGLPAG